MAAVAKFYFRNILEGSRLEFDPKSSENMMALRIIDKYVGDANGIVMFIDVHGVKHIISLSDLRAVSVHIPE